MNLEFSRQFFGEKVLNYQFLIKSFQWEPSRCMRTGHTDRHNEANSRFSKVYERAWNRVGTVHWLKQTRLPKWWTYQMNLQVHKVRFPLYTPWRNTGELVLNYHAFLTSAPDGGVWSTSCQGRFTSGVKSHRYPLNRRLSGYQTRFGRFGKEINCLPLAEFEPRTVTAKSLCWLRSPGSNNLHSRGCPKKYWYIDTIIASLRT